MAVDAIVDLPKEVWTQITDADITLLTVIHRGGGDVLLKPTVGANAPASTYRGGLPIAKGRDGFVDGFLKETLTDLDITASVTRVYAFALGNAAKLYVQTD